MSTAQWIFSLVLLGWVLARNLGARRMTVPNLLIPLAIVLAAAAWYLQDVPTAGHDIELDLVGAAVGLVMGIIAVAATKTSHRGGHLVVTAGAAFAAVWVVAIAGRILFIEWATHGGARAIAEFSVRHQITGADAWTAAIVLMALTMVTVRLTVNAVQLFRHRLTITAPSRVGAA